MDSWNSIFKFKMAAGPTAIPKFRCPPLRINPAFRIAKPSNFISKGTSYFEISFYGLVKRRYHDLDHEHDYGAESGSSQDYKVRICAFRLRTERWPKSRGSGRNRRFVRHPTSPTPRVRAPRRPAFICHERADERTDESLSPFSIKSGQLN